MPTRQANNRLVARKLRELERVPEPPVTIADPLATPAFLKRARTAPGPAAAEDEPEPWEIETAEVLKTEGLRWCRVYYYGEPIADKRVSVGVTDAPVLGWSGAYVIPGDRMSTLFCPYSFKAFTVANDCVEVARATDAPHEGGYHRGLLLRNYRRAIAEGSTQGLDVAAVVMTRLGMDVPVYERPEPAPGAPEKPKRERSGGKPINEEGLRALKPMGRRADVARRFLSGAPVSIRAAMAELGMDRNALLSHLYYINRDHGLGYELGSDCARILVPDGFEPFGAGLTVTETAGEIEIGDRITAPGHPLDGGRIAAVVGPEKTYVEGEYEIEKSPDGKWRVSRGDRVERQAHASMKEARTWCKRKAVKAGAKR